MALNLGIELHAGIPEMIASYLERGRLYLVGETTVYAYEFAQGTLQQIAPVYRDVDRGPTLVMKNSNTLIRLGGAMKVDKDLFQPGLSHDRPM